jgi:hypothetical protein
VTPFDARLTRSLGALVPAIASVGLSGVRTDVNHFQWYSARGKTLRRRSASRVSFETSVGGFEPPTLGLGTRCPIQTRPHAHRQRRVQCLSTYREIARLPIVRSLNSMVREEGESHPWEGCPRALPWTPVETLRFPYVRLVLLASPAATERA